MPGTLQLKLRNTLWTELSAGRRRGLTCKNQAVTSEPLLFNYFVSPPSLSVFPLQRWPALSREAAPIISTALSFLALWPYPNPLRWLLLIPTNSRRTGQTEGGRGGLWVLVAEGWNRKTNRQLKCGLHFNRTS